MRTAPAWRMLPSAIDALVGLGRARSGRTIAVLGDIWTLRILRTAKAGMWTWRPDSGQVEVCGNLGRMAETRLSRFGLTNP